ncbi:hypothetical protein [Paenibacillus sp. OAS669]|uniref:hypothetical protein n=1 Tax=Paenibacillus sp. OAS669 TaxID=2663821 RepID=UPI00178AF843|nr:hypothetical protein [Paenibacillus sp. OAS669]MBE1444412.1 hypothetical protein [Paenibacillus sp. OAS669]
MSKVFVEYQILPAYRSNYSEWVTEVRALYENVEFFEGSDQPGLFVELWNDMSKEQYQLLKQVRQGQAEEREATAYDRNPFDSTNWSRLGEWVKGGIEKVHIWHFEKVK